MKKFWRVILWGLFVVTSGASFPMYNFGKHYTYALTGITLYLNLVCYIELGIYEKKIIRNLKIQHVCIINIGIILLGMLCRYLFEFGEVSNTYNFTLPNVLFHICVTYVISVFSYWLTKNKHI